MKNNRRIRGIALLLFILITLPLLCLTVAAADGTPPKVEQVDAFCVINTEYKKVMLEKGMTQQIYPASTVKLMTALVAYDHFSSGLESYILITEEMKAAFVGGRITFEIGEYVRVIDLLHALLCNGDNNSAVILAFASCGGIETFCKEMNQKAVEIGAVNTHYTNPTGLHDAAMVTTAHDTALIGLTLFKNQTLFEITKVLKYTLPATNKNQERIIYNRNPMITTNMTEEYYYSYAEGMSAGGTDEGGDCVVTAGELDGLSYICVVMGGRPAFEDDETNYACIAAKNLLRYALVSYQVKTLRTAKYEIATIPVRFSATEETVSVKMSRDLSALLYHEVDVEKNIEYRINVTAESLDAPVADGLVVGTIEAIYNGAVLDSTELITASAIESHGFLIFMYKLKAITSHPVFVIILLIAIAALVYFLLKRFPINKKKDRHKRNRYF